MPNPPLMRNAGPLDERQVVLELVRETVAELRREPVEDIRVALGSSLERDLGLDSLARVELLHRLEQKFAVTLPDDALQLVETPSDLLAALETARTGSATPRTVVRSAPPAARSIVGQPADASTLLEVLDWHMRMHPEVTQIRYLSDGGEEEISYAGLHSGSAAVAQRLQREGLTPRQTVAIMLPTCPAYFYTYFGILLAGGIPVPIYPPARLSQIEDHVRRHAGILANAQARILITVQEAMPVARMLEASVPGLRRVLSIAEPGATPGRFSAIPVSSDDVAFIQYTSGSTGNPKGVVLTHANLLANIRAIGAAIHIKPLDVFVSWLPLYHDMGLISAWLASLYFGNPLVVMSPLAFLARPERWLWAIHRHRGTLTAAPNFAYELCLKRVDETQLEGLDLGSLRLMANGAEPVSPDTLERFLARFGRYGLDRGAMAPVYGLAESTVGLLCPPMGRGPLIDRIRREPFVSLRRAVPAPEDDPKPLRFVACGGPLPGHEVRIVDDAGTEAGERIEGRLEFRGPSATRGYFRNSEETERLFHDGWLDSGDRAYRADGDYYVTGRVKDIIIRGGRNIYPHELEEAVGALADVRKGCVAVFGSPDPQTGTERLVVLAETRLKDPAARATLRQTINRTASDVLGEAPEVIVLAPPHTVLKTSSGKIRRAASRELYEAGLVGSKPPAVWRSLLKFGLRSIMLRVRRRAARAGQVLYRGYVWALFWLIAPVVWLVTVLALRPAAAWSVGRNAARLFLKVTGSVLVVRGLENLPRGSTSVLVANHASYADGLVLMAAVPTHFAFVAKQELRERFVSRVYLEKLGAEFAERFDVRQRVEAAARLVDVASRGKSLVFFPEGTFTDAPGLLPFHLGAFVVAARARVPIVPVAIRGSRALLRGDRWVPQRGMLTVTIGTPIAPRGDGANTFSAAAEMRDAARRQILRECGEAELESAA